MNPLTPDEESALRSALDGTDEAAMRVKSSLGPQLDRLRAGTAGCQFSPSEGLDLGPVAKRFSEVMARLGRVRDEHRVNTRAAEDYYRGFQVRGIDPDRQEGDAPPDHGHVQAPLAAFGNMGLVMLALSDRPDADLRADAKKARGGNRAAIARLEKERDKANAYMAGFWAAYAATRPPRVETDESRERAGKARARREGERREAFAGRVTDDGKVVYSTAKARRAG